MAGKRSNRVECDHALRELAEGAPACTRCRPDSEPGYLDWLPYTAAVQAEGGM
ncbi:DUF6233 domain-containing protein [Streptomyces olivochromogenes]|uniref:DUF6233 domain-containing protein n=1 Tax=Streptomyces olivochromogenes TaxID=1963 RepID=UPI0036CE2855